MQRAHLPLDSDTGQRHAWQADTTAPDQHAHAILDSPRQADARALGALLASSPRLVAQRQQAAQLFGPTAPHAHADRTGLPAPLKQGIQALSGVSLDSVRVHYNSDRPAQLGAHAYAQGQDIHLAPGQERHLPHEAWHVVQQAQGRVAPTLRMANGTALNDDAGLEHEADTMGARALQRVAATDTRQGLLMAPATQGAVQRVGEEWVGQIGEALGIAASAATQFMYYLLRTYPIYAIAGMLGSAALVAAYARYTRHPEDVDESESESDSGAESDSDDGTESDADSEDESGSGSGSGSDSDSGSGSGSEENTDDFWWDGRKAKRAKGPLSPYRKAEWDRFIRQGPPLAPTKKVSAPKKRGARKKKINWNDEVAKSKRQHQADSVGKVAKSPAYKPYTAVPIAGSTPFFVNIEKRAEGTKSSSLSGKAGTKPLAVVYGHYGAATYKDSITAEVHVHFNPHKDVDSHTGAHVKIGTTYPHSWASGNASTQADLASILNAGFHGDAWTRGSTYV